MHFDINENELKIIIASMEQTVKGLNLAKSKARTPKFAELYDQEITEHRSIMAKLRSPSKLEKK